MQYISFFVKSRICIVEKIRISYLLALSRMARFYATTEQKLIHSFWNALRNFVGKSTNYTKVRVIHHLYTTLHKTILGFADIGSMEKKIDFFLYHPLTHVKLQKSIVEFHTSKNILKMIKQRNQSRQVLFYISNTHFYTLVCWFHVNKEVYWFLNRPPPFLPRTLPFWQMMVNNP
jgi:hypothetical protein